MSPRCGWRDSSEAGTLREWRPHGSGLGRQSLCSGRRTNSGVDEKALILPVVASLSSSFHSCLPVKVATGCGPRGSGPAKRVPGQKNQT